MSRYVMIRRLRGPAFVILVGVIALLAQFNILGWDKSWPLYLILWGALMLAERAALAAEQGYPPPPYAAGSYQNSYPRQYTGSNPASNPGACQAPNPGQYPGNPTPSATWTSVPPTGSADPATASTGTAIVPVPPHDLAKNPNDFEGGQS
jgi:hypothetical protein